ncbi:hypothetical protein [Streptomyces hydrogenans]
MCVPPLLPCIEIVPAATTSMWGTIPQWASVAGTLAATITALWIALRQGAAAERVLAGGQREKAALIALEGLDAQGVTIRNHGQTPVTNVSLTAEAYLDEFLGDPDGWVTVGWERAVGSPDKVPLLRAGEGVRFEFVRWHSPDVPNPDPTLRRGRPDVTITYTDAVGTRWQRVRYDLPVPWGGAPLPGAARERRREARRRRRRQRSQRRRVLWRNLKLGLRGKGFTRESQKEKRKKARSNEAGGE